MDSIIGYASAQSEQSLIFFNLFYRSLDNKNSTYITNKAVNKYCDLILASCTAREQLCTKSDTIIIL